MENRNLGIGLIVTGAVLLAVRFFGSFDIPAMTYLWPFFVIIPGVALLFSAYILNNNEVKLAVPGAIVTTTGVILLTFNTFGHWEAWSYAWTFYPIVTGATLNYIGWRKRDEAMQTSGRKSLIIGMYLLAGFAFFFEGMIFGGNASWLNSLIWPVLLIAAGGFLVLNRRPDTRQSDYKSKNDSIFAG